jgi:hypothetical protein
MPYKDPIKQKKFLQKWYLKRKAQKQKFVEKIKQKPCSRCKKKFPPVCMDLHHIDPSTKKDTISYLMKSTQNINLLIEEVKKCQLLCSNCHRILHYYK